MTSCMLNSAIYQKRWELEQLWTMWLSILFSIPGSISTNPWMYLAIYSVDIWNYFTVFKWPGHEADHSLTSQLLLLTLLCLIHFNLFLICSIISLHYLPLYIILILDHIVIFLFLLLYHHYLLNPPTLIVLLLLLLFRVPMALAWSDFSFPSSVCQGVFLCSDCLLTLLMSWLFVYSDNLLTPLMSWIFICSDSLVPLLMSLLFLCLSRRYCF